MENRKRRLSSLSELQSNTCKQPRVDWSWDESTLPLELVHKLLQEATSDNVPLLEGILTAVVCRSVCTWWRSLLPSPTKGRGYLAFLSLPLKVRQSQLLLQQQKHTVLVDFGYIAARYGRASLLRWVLENKCPLTENMSAAAARGGHLGLLQWLKESRCPWNERRIWLGAAKGGHLEVLKWLLKEEERAKEKTKSDHILMLTLMSAQKAAAQGYTAIVAYLLDLMDQVHSADRWNSHRWRAKFHLNFWLGCALLLVIHSLWEFFFFFFFCILLSAVVDFPLRWTASTCWCLFFFFNLWMKQPVQKNFPI